MSAAVVEVLTNPGCPHAESALEMVRRVLEESNVVATVRCIDVTDPASAEAHRFLGSPTIRVNGADVEPGADERDEFAVGCRLYRTRRGVEGKPDERWVHDALRCSA